ncbi:F0F1 ATP synthase subunit epsilon [Xanthobacteraceae bacterium Astr-EGSB]|uniref:F0F1 ATP synthase subunit epsilon n=1 Tax=Astrobacterium formosum TaxID=3069710 RepID=UPI0027B38C83|nr:F0F1 ATP synthase subunit epsilon [Xanthobacteraceae bacterium Astr-EGSB]
MATFHFDLVSPEKLLFSGDVTQVDVPGQEGDFGVFAGHAPFVAMMKPGVLTVYGDGTRQRIVVQGGFAEVGPTGLTVLADDATPVEEIDSATLTQAIKDAEEDVSDAADPASLDTAKTRLEHLKTLKSALGH